MKICPACQKHFIAQNWDCPRCGHKPSVIGDVIVLAPEIATDNDGFNPVLFQQYAALEENHFWFIGRGEIIRDAVRKQFPFAPNMLEIGCGNGAVLAELGRNFPGMKLCGADAYLQGLAYAAKRTPAARLYQMDATRMPFREEFYLVGAFDVLEHIEDDTGALLQMFNTCKPGGGIVLTVPQHPLLWSRTDEYAHHKRRYTRKELVSKVEQAGFRVQRVTSFVSLLLPMMMLSRIMQRNHVRQQDSIDTGFRIAKPLNKLLGWVLGLERIAIKFGISFPVGGSLMLVATKDAVTLFD